MQIFKKTISDRSGVYEATGIGAIFEEGWQIVQSIIVLLFIAAAAVVVAPIAVVIFIIGLIVSTFKAIFRLVFSPKPELSQDS